MKRLTSLAALVLSAIVLFAVPATFATADRAAKAGPAGLAKQVKKLKRQVKQLQERIDGGQSTAGPQGPEGPPGPANGPAAGDLTGNYPNPRIAPGAVGTAEIADGGVMQPDVGALAISAGKIQTGAVDSGHILDHSVAQRDLAGSSVGAIELKATRSVVGPGVQVNAGAAQTATVTCPGLGTALGGGFAWQKDGAGSITYSVPEEANSHTWAVRGTVPSGTNTLYAWARCVDR